MKKLSKRSRPPRLQMGSVNFCVCYLVDFCHKILDRFVKSENTHLKLVCPFELYELLISLFSSLFLEEYRSRRRSIKRNAMRRHCSRWSEGPKDGIRNTWRARKSWFRSSSSLFYCNRQIAPDGRRIPCETRSARELEKKLRIIFFSEWGKISFELWVLRKDLQVIMFPAKFSHLLAMNLAIFECLNGQLYHLV